MKRHSVNRWRLLLLVGLAGVVVLWGYSHAEHTAALHWIRKKLVGLAGEKAFEPLGWVRHSEGNMLLIHRRPDFLQPVSDDPKVLLLGTSLPPS